MRDFTLFGFFARMKTGSRCLDLGAGDGRLWNLPVRNKAQVVAIDICESPDIVPAQVQWIHGDLRRGLAGVLFSEERFDFIMCVNLIQFLPRDCALRTLLPSLALYARPGCRLVIETFYNQPHPAFLEPVPSLYRFEELVAALPGWQIENGGEYEADDKGYDGQTRHWSVTDLLAVRI